MFLRKLHILSRNLLLKISQSQHCSCCFLSVCATWCNCASAWQKKCLKSLTIAFEYLLIIIMLCVYWIQCIHVRIALSQLTTANGDSNRRLTIDNSERERKEEKTAVKLKKSKCFRLFETKVKILNQTRYQTNKKLQRRNKEKKKSEKIT